MIKMVDEYMRKLEDQTSHPNPLWRSCAIHLAHMEHQPHREPERLCETEIGDDIGTPPI